MDATTETAEAGEESEASGPSLLGMDSDMAANPQATYSQLRADSPVLAIEGMGVILSRKADIDEALRHPETFTSNMSAIDLKNARPLIPLQIDPPDHKKYRKLLDPIFAPRLMTAMEDEVAILVNDLIDRFIDRGEVDFAAEFSVPYPSQVFLTLLGLPLDELDRFLAMKDGIIRPGHLVGTDYGSPEADAHQQLTADSIYEYFNKVLDERESAPEDDLVSRFLSAEVEGNKLTREDILDICFLFLIAGLDTVTATLDCMFAYLAQHPDHRQQLVDDPSLIPSAIEELLRWETPVSLIARASLEDTTLAGCPVSKGDSVILLLGSANTDEGEVEDAGTVRFDREINRHIAFGGGIHRCLGSHLARMELRVALREWHRRIPEYSVEPGHTLEYTPSIRSIEHFPMRFTKAGA
jgi:cytochrome P450